VRVASSRGDADPATPEGDRLWASCSCGARLKRWVTPADASPRGRPPVSALLPPGARVLDVGCGEGRDSVFFAERGFDVTGVDIARSGLAKAELRDAKAW
jgi:2-polyprenyl-3-methyl-5-hydroxy-6-metoxy-1,4-benzoquinol methylase